MLPPIELQNRITIFEPTQTGLCGHRNPEKGRIPVTFPDTLGHARTGAGILIGANTFPHSCSPHLPSTCSSCITKSSLLFTMNSKRELWHPSTTVSDGASPPHALYFPSFLPRLTPALFQTICTRALACSGRCSATLPPLLPVSSCCLHAFEVELSCGCPKLVLEFWEF